MQRGLAKGRRTGFHTRNSLSGNFYLILDKNVAIYATLSSYTVIENRELVRLQPYIIVDTAVLYFGREAAIQYKNSRAGLAGAQIPGSRGEFRNSQGPLILLVRPGGMRLDILASLTQGTYLLGRYLVI